MFEYISGRIGLHVNADKTEYTRFIQNQARDSSTQTDSSLKLVDKFTWLRRHVSSSENDPTSKNMLRYR